MSYSLATEPMELKDHLFVYGTLRRGGRLHHHLLAGGISWAGSARIRGQIYQVPGTDYPGAIPSDNPKDNVCGELYHMREPERTLPVLDRIEGCRTGEFRRDLVDVWVRQSTTKAWVYFYARPLTGADRIQNGRYPRTQGPMHRAAAEAK